MGLEILGGNPVEAVLDIVTSRAETARRQQASVRVRLYSDDYTDILREQIGGVFLEPAVISRLLRFSQYAGASSIVKRVSDEVARPLYARAPFRRVMMPGELEPATPDGEDGFKLPESSPQQQAWNELAAEMRLDRKHDLVARLLTPCPDMFELVRYVPEFDRMCLDVLTPDMVSVIPHPQDYTQALAIVYDSSWDYRGRVCQRVLWDDKRVMVLDEKGDVIRVVDHDYGLIPIVQIHRKERVGCYFAAQEGNDLVAAAAFEMLMDIITVRKLKTQSHIQLAYSGDIDRVIKDQVSDEESILMVNGGAASGAGQLYPINLESDPSPLLKAREMIETNVAANYGISRDRLNQKTGDVGEDVGLKERVNELAQVMAEAEQSLFTIVKQVSREHPRHKIAPDAKLVVDLGSLHDRVDRSTQLAVRREEKSQGIRSAVDDVLEDHPEFGGDRRLAVAFIDEKAREQAVVVERQRALNLPQDGGAGEPGQSPQQNGAMGPNVRDGKMSKDDAAAQARGPREAGAAYLKRIRNAS